MLGDKHYEPWESRATDYGDKVVDDTLDRVRIPHSHAVAIMEIFAHWFKKYLHLTEDMQSSVVDMVYMIQSTDTTPTEKDAAILTLMDVFNIN